MLRICKTWVFKIHGQLFFILFSNSKNNINNNNKTMRCQWIYNFVKCSQNEYIVLRNVSPSETYSCPLIRNTCWAINLTKCYINPFFLLLLFNIMFIFLQYNFLILVLKCSIHWYLKKPYILINNLF